MYDIAIIGAGPAGYTAAELAAKRGLKTILFEKDNLGGVCLNEGCIPTKTLLYSAKVLNTAKESSKYGISCDSVSFDLSKIIARKNKVVRKLVAGIRMRMNEAGVETIAGEAMVISTTNGITIRCGEESYIAGKLLLATGSEAILPPIPGIETAPLWTSREALDNKELPASLLVIGGGVIGVEFASFFNALGVQVHVVEMMEEILPGMDKETTALLRAELTKRGITFHLSARVKAIKGNAVEVEQDGQLQTLTAERVLLSAGRKPCLEGFGLEHLSLERFGSGLKVNEFMQTSHPDIYACGDLTGFSMLAHTAVREAEVAVEHILGGVTMMSYDAVPAVVYTQPELASIGKTEELLEREQIAYRARKLPMTYSGRFVAENEQATGLCKILESPDGRILGAHLLGNPASELIVIAGMAIDRGMTVDELKAIIFPHPTVGEILKETVS